MAGFDPVSLGLEFGLGSILSNMFGSKGRDNTEDVIGQFQRDVAARPDYSFLQQDPLVQGLQTQGNTAGNVARQNALSQLMRSGFGRSNIAASTGARAGTQAQQPFVNAQQSMLSNLQQQAEQQRLQSLRDVLGSRLGKARRGEQVDAGIGLGLGKSVLGNVGGFGDFLQSLGSTPGQGVGGYLPNYRPNVGGV